MRTPEEPLNDLEQSALLSEHAIGMLEKGHAYPIDGRRCAWGVAMQIAEFEGYRSNSYFNVTIIVNGFDFRYRKRMTPEDLIDLWCNK